MKKTALILMIITILSKVFGFAREVILSYFYGASSISDAYLISLTIPSVLFGFIGTGISTGFIPMFSKIETSLGWKAASRYMNSLINIVLVFCSVIVIVGICFTEEIVKIFASGFSGATLELAVRFTRISLIGIYFTGLVSIMSGFLQIKGNYVIPALIGIPMNFFVISSIVLSYKINCLVLAIGRVIAMASQLILLLPFIYRKGYRYRFVLDARDEYITEMARIALPVIIGVSVNQINVLVDRTIASGIAVGGISALNYANRLCGFVQGLFVAPIAIVMYPIISKLAAENNRDGFKKTVSEAISTVNLLVIPVTIGAMIFAEPVVSLVFGRGAFDAVAMDMTVSSLFYYSIGMLGVGLRDILSRAFYSMQDTKTPMINASVAVLMNIVLNIVLSRFMGIGGLALATSISALFCTGTLFVSLRKKAGPLGLKSVAISLLKSLCSSLIMGVVAKFAFKVLGGYMSVNLSLLMSIAVGAVVYFIMVYLMGVKEVHTVVSTVRQKLENALER